MRFATRRDIAVRLKRHARDVPGGESYWLARAHVAVHTGADNGIDFARLERVAMSLRANRGLADDAIHLLESPTMPVRMGSSEEPISTPRRSRASGVRNRADYAGEQHCTVRSICRKLAAIALNPRLSAAISEVRSRKWRRRLAAATRATAA